MGHRHIFSQTSHRRHFITADGVYNRSGAKKEQGLKHRMRKQVKHTGNVS